MSEPVTAYAAARVLRRDRQTVVRVTDCLHPDAFDRQGHPLWRIERIAAALAMNSRERRDAGRAIDRFSIHNEALFALRSAFERQIAAIEAETSSDKRRQMAIELAPVLGQFQAAYLDIGRQLHVAEDDAIVARSDLLVQEMLDEVSVAAGWSRAGDSGFDITMIEAMSLNAEEGEGTDVF